MPYKPIESFPAGGVDSRSNPIVMPPDAFLSLVNWWPRQDGSLQLRDGYSLIKNTGVTYPIYSIQPITGPGPSYKHLIIFWQNKVPYTLDPSTGIITTPIIKGAAITSGARFNYFYTNGHLHAFNGTDAKWFDGVYWRDIGLPTLTAAQVAAISVGVDGATGLTPTQASAITLTFASGGNWPGTDVTGELVYAAILSQTPTGLPILSPWVQLGGGYRVMGLLSQQLELGALPTLPSGDYLVFGITSDGGAEPFICAEQGSGSSATALPGPGSTTWSTGLATVDSTAHGIATSAVIAGKFVNGIVSGSFGPVVATKLDANHYTFSDSRSLLNGATITAYTVVTGTTILNYQWTVPSFSVSLPGTSNIAASTVGGTQPGYQFYASIYDATTSHVGNRVAIGARLAPQGPFTPILSGLPTLSDPEWSLLIGRTGDGAEIPYAVIDGNGNWITTTAASLVIPYGNIDGNTELPSRNYPPPGTLDCNYQYSLLPGGAAQNPPITGTFVRAWVESDHMCGVLANSPTIYRSGSALDMREGVFVGLPEQCYDPADIETFPTADPVTCGQGYQQESWCYSLNDCAVLMELSGETQWQGPWNIGCAGQYAWARGWQNLPYWVTGDKQLATISAGGYQQIGAMMTSAMAGPLPISDEYEAALLSRIGDQYLSQVEVVYIRIPEKRIEVLRINCLDESGNAFTVIHDFNMRDGNAPYGKAYEEDFLGQLAAAYTMNYVRDQNGRGQIFAGGTDGNLYELYNGGNDNGTEFTATGLKLANIGPARTTVQYLEWYGDELANWFLAAPLDTPFDTTQMVPLNGPGGDGSNVEAVREQGEGHNGHWIVAIDNPELVHAYLVIQLTSHSADGTTALNTPPHIPLETYGRVWLAAPLLGTSKGK